MTFGDLPVDTLQAHLVSLYTDLSVGIKMKGCEGSCLPSGSTSYPKRKGLNTLKYGLASMAAMSIRAVLSEHRCVRHGVPSSSGFWHLP